MDAQELRNLQEAYVDVYCELDEGTAEDVAARARKLARRKGQTPEKQKIYQDLANKAGERARQNDPTQTVGSSRFAYNQRHGRPLITPQVSQSRSSQETLGGGTYRRGSERLPNSQRKHDAQVVSGVRAASEQEKKRARERMGIGENYDLYDIILSHLLDEGYAETVKAAESIMVNMSEDWREDIVEEFKELPISRMNKQARRIAFSHGTDVNSDEGSSGNVPHSNPTKALAKMARIGGEKVKKHIKKGYEQGSKYDPYYQELNSRNPSRNKEV